MDFHDFHLNSTGEKKSHLSPKNWSFQSPLNNKEIIIPNFSYTFFFSSSASEEQNI